MWAILIRPLLLLQSLLLMVGSSCASGCSQTINSHRTTILDLPGYILDRIGFYERADICKLLQQVENVEKSPVNPFTFFQILTGGDYKPIELFIQQRKIFIERKEEAILSFLNLITDALPYDMAKAFMISKKYPARAVELQPLGTHFLGHPIAKNLVLSLYFNIGSFKYLSDAHRFMFKCLCELYFPYDVDAIRKLAECFHKGETTLLELFKNPMIDKEWLLNHLMTLTDSSDDKRSGKHLFIDDSLMEESALVRLGELFAHYHAVKSRTAHRVIDLLLWFWNDNKITEKIDRLLDYVKVNREQVNAVLRKDYSGVKENPALLMFVRDFDDFKAINKFFEYLRMWPPIRQYEYVSTVKLDEMGKWIASLSPRLVSFIIDSISKYHLMDSEVLTREQVQLVEIAMIHFKRSGSQEKRQIFRKLLPVMEHTNHANLGYLMEAGLRKYGKWIEPDYLVGFIKRDENLPDGWYKLPRFLQAVFKHGFVSTSQRTRLVQQAINMQQSFNFGKQLIAKFQEEHLRGVFLGNIVTVNLFDGKRDYTLTVPSVIRAMDLYAIVKVSVGIDQAFKVFYEVESDSEATEEADSTLIPLDDIVLLKQADLLRVDSLM